MQEVTYQSANRVAMLKQRVKRCVCKYCGSTLKLKSIVFSEFDEARVEIFCKSCNRIEFGVEPEIYASAKYFVEESRFNCYPDLDDNDRTRQMTISKVCEIMAWENQSIGILREDGFNIPLNMNEHIADNCMILTEDDLREAEADEMETIVVMDVEIP